MKTTEKENNEKKDAEKSHGTSCCCPEGFAEMVGQCCESAETGPDCCSPGIAKTFDCSAMMGHCMKKCRWFPLVPITAGIILFVLGYYLNPETTRLLWMVVSGLVIVMGVFGLLMMNAMKKNAPDSNN